MLSNENNNIEMLKRELNRADAILIGAGAGLSTSAGLTYSGERFKKHFSDYERKYGFHDMYSGGFYHYSSLEEMWAFQSRNIMMNRYENAPLPVYEHLYELVKNKDYFVLTTNVDHCFQKSGFDKRRLFYTQGDYGLFQCSGPCYQYTYDNFEVIKKMVDTQIDLKIPSELIPRCPICSRPMTMNLRSDDKFVQDDGWYKAAERYKHFVGTRENKALLLLELGVGFNTPGIIKYPFWHMTLENPKAVYVCINHGAARAPKEIVKRSICINADIGDVLNKLLDNYGGWQKNDSGAEVGLFN
jgi:NAD-dependent SIR2 family protein deacetylase